MSETTDGSVPDRGAIGDINGAAGPGEAPGADEIGSGETIITEITLQPDGRVYVFGTSRPVLEILRGLNPNDPRLGQLLSHVRSLEAEGGKPL